MTKNLPEAVCILMVKNDQVLVVSRRNDSTQWGMPGGKVDPGETAMQAVMRETLEEIGFELEASKLHSIYQGPCDAGPDGKAFQVTTYLYLGPVPELVELRPEPGLTVAMKPLRTLIVADQSPFAHYNIRALHWYEEYRSALAAE